MERGGIDGKRLGKKGVEMIWFRKEAWDEKTNQVIIILETETGNKVRYMGRGVFEQTNKSPDGRTFTQPKEEYFPIEAKSLYEAFAKFKDKSAAALKKLQGEAEENNRRVVKATQGQVPPIKVVKS